MKELYNGLLKLESELTALQSLTLQEREDIAQLNILSLEKHQMEIERLLSQFNEFNGMIAASIASLCQKSGLTPPYTLTALLAIIPTPDRDLFGRLQRTLKQLSVSVENNLIINKALIRDSLDFTTKSLNLFTTTLKTTGTSTYGNHGRFVECVGQPHIICKEI